MHRCAVTFAERAHKEYGADPDIGEFPEGTKTAEDAVKAIGCDVAQLASSLVFDINGLLVISATSGAHQVS